MANNPYVNKVVFNNNTLIDLSSDTVTASKLAQGYTAHSASGAQITGTMPEGGGGEYDIEGTTLASGGQQLDITDAETAISIEPITITQNGTTTAPTGKAYSPITTNVPQTTINSLSVTENGTYTAPSGTAYSPVTVNVSGGVSGVLKANLDGNGNATMPTSLDASSIVTIGNNALRYWQYNNTTLTGAISFTNLTAINATGLTNAFYGCSYITSVSFPLLQTIGSSGLSQAFYNCSRLAGSISFPYLTTIASDAFSNAFAYSRNITALHFREDMQSTVAALTGYTSKFGATNATIYFDL